MKKLITCFFALAIAAPNVMAATGGISRALPSSKSDSTTDTSTRGNRTTVARTTATTSVQTESNSNPAPNRATASRALPTTGTTGRTNNATTTHSATTSRATQSNTTARSNLDAAVNTVGRNARVTAGSINNNPSVRRAGLTLRPTTAEVGGRATIGDTNIQTGSNIDESVRGVQSRAASKQISAESIAQAKERLEQTAELNKSCQEQYNDCMDQFCAVIDSNQKRCSCSSNLAKYTKVESAVKEANNQLNDVAQRIRYIGLSADEIRAIMTETEAEEALSGTTDTSETRSMLQDIEDLIKDPSSASSYYSDNSFGLDLDLDLDFTSDGGDIFSIDFLNANSSNTFSNMRGAQLYNAAKKRCNTVLTQCKDAGATSQQITGNYDLAIDKDCIAYEQGLTKMNETLVSNVRSANRMLQKARLSVLQNKNQYDAKGCIAALNTCMTDDMVCGESYTKCLDPTKRFIDENGNVVLGQNITSITSFMEKYDNANVKEDTLRTAYSMTSVDAASCAGTHNDGSCVLKYLMTKIGTKQKTTDEGLCRAVLDKCQRYTYDSNGNYKPYNDIVVNYVQRAMVNIKSAQQSIISDYASNCMVDVAKCYNQQVSQVNAWSSSASAASIQAVMRGACRNVALTCGYAIFDGPPAIDLERDPVPGCTYVTQNRCDEKSDGNDKEACKNSAFIDCVSDMFYQSLLCPDNSTYQYADGNTISQNGCGDKVGDETCMVNARCKCNSGYTVWGGNCVPSCDPSTQKRNTSGSCVAQPTTTE